MTEKKTDEERMQQKYMELQIMGKQIKSSQQQVEMMDEQLSSISGMIKDLDQLKEAKLGSEMLSLIGEGIFVKAELKDTEEIIVNVGAGVAVTKKVDEAKDMLKKRLAQGHKHRIQLMAELEGMIMEAQATEKELAAMIE